MNRCTFNGLKKPSLPTLLHNVQLLIQDGASSHVSVDLIRSAIANGVILLCLPPKTTHITQPIDVAVYRKMKIETAKMNKVKDSHNVENEPVSTSGDASTATSELCLPPLSVSNSASTKSLVYQTPPEITSHPLVKAGLIPEDLVNVLVVPQPPTRATKIRGKARVLTSADVQANLEEKEKQSKIERIKQRKQKRLEKCEKKERETAKRREEIQQRKEEREKLKLEKMKAKEELLRQRQLKKNKLGSTQPLVLPQHDNDISTTKPSDSSVKVVGMRHYGTRQLHLTGTYHVQLEESNPYDSMAVAVFDETNKVANLKRDSARAVRYLIMKERATAKYFLRPLVESVVRNQRTGPQQTCVIAFKVNEKHIKCFTDTTANHSCIHTKVMELPKK
ncbi:hypothetical protein ACF0H5_013351 [Mactra antiquata]